MADRYIVVAGTIAAGKSTLINSIQKVRPGWDYFLEKAEANPFLKPCYDHKEKPNPFSFKSQMFFLSANAEQCQLITKSSRTAVHDRSIYENRQFARLQHEFGMMTADEMKLYNDIFDILAVRFQKPSHVVYLRPTLEECIDRQRSRDGYEIDTYYLKRLYDSYDGLMSEFGEKVKTSDPKFDGRDPEQVRELVERLEKKF